MLHLKSAIAACFLLAFPQPAHSQVHSYSGKATAQIENLGDLTHNQRAGIEKFAQARPYFGAIYIEQGGSGWGSFTGAHSLTDAADIAQRICQHYASGGHCIMAGILYPEDLDKENIPANTLSERGAKKHAIYSARTQGYRAFATSGNTAFGWATRRETAQEATEAALVNCFTSSMKNLLKLEVDLRAAAMKDGLYTCRIVDSAGPNQPPS